MQLYELKNWEISGYYPYIPLLGMESPRLGRSITDWIPAEVPGSVHADLMRAGRIKDPYKDMNSLECEWVENKWWAYRTEFHVEKHFGCRYRLNMRGLDYKCRIYLNDKLLDIHEGSFTPYIRDITNELQQSNRLIILFEAAPDEDSQAGHTSHTHTQKSRFSYKWDFGTRMVPVGIWDRAFIEETGEATLDDIWLIPEIKGTRGKVTLRANCTFGSGCIARKFDIELCISKGSNFRIEKRESFDIGRLKSTADMEVWLDDVERWYPNGLGAQPLYDVDIILKLNGEASHSWHGQIGFKDFRWVQTEGADCDALPYCLEFDSKRVYMKGVNLTPFDMLIGSVSDETYRRFLHMIKAANINFVRVNGVGLIEKEVFYSLCDQMGILVWQEFIQTSSSMDRVPPCDPNYLKLLAETTVSAIKQKRNHVCLACYCAGNELTDAPGVAATAHNPNVRFIQKLVDLYDTGRMLFPASASGPNEFLEMDRFEGNHDVHGPWNYDPDTHYKLFNQSNSMLHGELGAEGMASLESLRRFLSDEHLHVTTMQDDLVWRHHGDWWDPCKLIHNLFGDITDLGLYANASQVIQAEAIRYCLESNRRRKYQNSGVMMWAFNEPYPNVSNTSLVDYYGTAKMSYYAAMAAYSPLHLSLRYDKLVWHKGEEFRAVLYCNNSLDARSINWRARMLTLDGNTLAAWDGTAYINADSACELSALSTVIDASFPDVFMLRIDFPDEAAIQPNEYFFSTAATTPFAVLLRQPVPSLKYELLETVSECGKESALYRISNEGSHTALFVHANLADDNRFVYCPENYRCLLPGESAMYHVHSLNKNADWELCGFEGMRGK